MGIFKNLFGTSENFFQIGFGSGAKSLKFGSLGTITWNPNQLSNITIPTKSGVVRVDDTLQPYLLAYKGSQQEIGSSFTPLLWETVTRSDNFTEVGNDTEFVCTVGGDYIGYACLQLYQVDTLRRIIVDICVNNVNTARLVDMGSGTIGVFNTLFVGAPAPFPLAAGDIVSVKALADSPIPPKNFYDGIPGNAFVNQLRVFKIFGN